MEETFSEERKMEETPATIATLSDDVLVEILVRVVDDLAALIRCATTCKRWCGLVADRSFFRRCWPEDTCQPLLGFFTTQWRPREKFQLAGRIKDKHALAPVFVPAPRSPLGRTGRHLSGIFVPDADSNVYLELATPLASRGGLLLVCLPYLSCVGLVVCNPLAGTRNELPKLHLYGFSITCCTILTAADCCSDERQRQLLPGYSSTFFKVLLIGRHREDSEQKLYMFSSTETSWSVPIAIKCLDQGDTRLYAPARGDAVVRRGTARWLLMHWKNFYTLDVSTENGHAFVLTKLSLPSNFVPFNLYDSRRLGIDADLSLVRMEKEGLRLEVWTQQNGKDSGQWLRTRMIELKGLTRRQTGERRYKYMCVGDMLLLLILEIDSQRVHIVDLETGAVEDASRKFDCTCDQIPVAFELDWRTHFISRLGVTRSSHT